MRRPNVYDFAAVLLFLAFVCGSILIVRKHEQKEQDFPVWKTLRREVFKNTDEIRKALRSNGFQIEYWANNILNKTQTENKKNGLELILISAAQLGFKDWVPYKNIYERAQKLDLKLLPAEAGPQLRLQYKDQPEDEWLHIGMEPILDSAGDPTIFDIMHFDNHGHGDNSAHSSHGHSLQLCSSSVRSDVLWSPSSKWVFQKINKSRPKP